MIELIINNFLDGHISVPVFLERPKKVPERFVLFEKTSSAKRNHINSATFAFQSYAKSMYDAAVLNEELKQVIESIIESDEIASVKLNSDYNFTDTETKEYRYQAVFDFKY
ncbi:hypothetical protein BG261_02800 [Floricoccus tropicus]|uniref:Phage protein n=1 Tax=Floricoccus tropicus TaxID=1859473 RepID=A0A1E8GMQ6_9LACT|nr:hypothetical protein [Floricoccus tropicus]OFI49525.1 hypothetical protein BG261_02800 [Floricoccus tropicus]